MTMPGSQISAKWANEYSREGIPSSYRSRPSNSLLEFLRFLSLHNIAPAAAVDIGCGAGRNTLELARRQISVVGFDIVESCIAELNEAAQRESLKSWARGVCTDATLDWPCETSSKDIAIDCFCFKHIIDPTGSAAYANNLARVLRPGGYFMMSCASASDGYYGSLPALPADGPGKLIIDPGNNIASRLYETEDLVRLFPMLTLDKVLVRNSRNKMHGHEYQRCTLVAYFRR